MSDQQDSFNTKKAAVVSTPRGRDRVTQYCYILPFFFFFFFFFKERKKTATCKTANLAPGNSEWQNSTNRRNKMINSNAEKKKRLESTVQDIT